MPATAASLDVENDSSGTRTVALAGRLDAEAVASLWPRARDVASASGPLVIDARRVEYCDVAGIALLVELMRSRAGAKVDVRGLADEYRALLETFEPARFAPKPDAPRPAFHLVEWLGTRTAGILAAIIRQVSFLGEASWALVRALRRPATVRWRDVANVAESTGVDALPIVALIAFLMGVILAFQSAVPMRQFGAEVFVADLVGLSMLRELGPLMTAILLAGRTGAAFAAELGTMKVNEEISALTTMGLDPVRFLVVPRLLAALIVTPLLTIFADLVGLIGGALTMLSFSIPTTTYFNELSGWVDTGDFLSGWVKSFVFGLLIAGIGCMKGLDTRNDAASVGESTTRAVVSAIITIVVVDGLFALMYYHLDV